MLKSTLKLARFLKSQLFIDYNSNYEDTIIVTGSGRSGTTWLSNIINSYNQYRFIFEPLYNQGSRKASTFNDRPYFKSLDDLQINILDEILCGKIRSLWTDKFNKKYFANRRLIKFIRASFILEYINLEYSKIPIIYIIRNPYSTIYSQIKVSDFDYLNQALKQKTFTANLEEINFDFTKKYNSTERLCILWCLENYFSIKSLNDDKSLLVSFEDLYLDKSASLDRINAFLNNNKRDKMFEVHGQTSQMARGNLTQISNNSAHTYWREKVDDNFIPSCDRILEKFGMDKLFSNSCLPKFKSFSKLQSLIDNNQIRIN